MFLAADEVVFSPSDLTRALACEFDLLRALDVKLGWSQPLEQHQDAMLARTSSLGDAHERRVLARFVERFGRYDPATRRGGVRAGAPGRARAGLAARGSGARARRAAQRRCLSFDGIEKFYGATQWLVYLIEHFLAPGAHAADSGLDCFRGFTFDHVLDGIIAACRRDTRELYLIEVEHNLVRERTLHAPQTRFLDADPLPYELTIDRDGERRRARRT